MIELYIIDYTNITQQETGRSFNSSFITNNYNSNNNNNVNINLSTNNVNIDGNSGLDSKDSGLRLEISDVKKKESENL